jgi:hypothetical protein
MTLLAKDGSLSTSWGHLSAPRCRLRHTGLHRGSGLRPLRPPGRTARELRHDDDPAERLPLWFFRKARLPEPGRLVPAGRSEGCCYRRLHRPRTDHVSALAFPPADPIAREGVWLAPLPPEGAGANTSRTAHAVSVARSQLGHRKTPSTRVNS